jgi:hypothetical protein
MRSNVAKKSNNVHFTKKASKIALYAVFNRINIKKFRHRN